MHVTQLLTRLEQGDSSAADELLPLVYAELRELARRKLTHEPSGQTLQGTALVHEAYLRLVGAEARPRWENRAHFFSAAAEAMRRILVESARRKGRLRHGGDLQRQDLDPDEVAVPEPPSDIVALDQALTELAAVDPQAAELVQLRYFAGLAIPECAEALGVSPRTADRVWAYAKAWLFARLRAE